MLRYTCIACLVLMLLWFWNLHSNSLSACTTTRGREFTISANLGFGQQTTELTELPRMYPAWNVVGGGGEIGCGVSHSKHRSAYSQVARCGAKGDLVLVRLAHCTATATGRYQSWLSECVKPVRETAVCPVVHRVCHLIRWWKWWW